MLYLLFVILPFDELNIPLIAVFTYFSLDSYHLLEFHTSYSSVILFNRVSYFLFEFFLPFVGVLYLLFKIHDFI